MRVLLVDADAEAVMHLRKLVSDIGLHVVGMTNDGEHAFSWLSSYIPTSR
jgi:two-component SAPR family response regulator